MADNNVKKWYVVRAVSGQENKVKNYIETEGGARRRRLQGRVEQRVQAFRGQRGGCGQDHTRGLPGRFLV